MVRVIKLISDEKTGFVFGNSLSEDPVIFHSDSLAAAIINNMYLLHPGYSFNEDSFPRISSLFYGISIGNKELFLLPLFKHKKITKLLEVIGGKKGDRKVTKRTKFISLNALYKIMYESLNYDDFKLNESITTLLTREEDDLIRNSDLEYLYATDTITRNKIDRFSSKVSEGSLFNVRFITLNDNIFFYFVIDDDKSFDEAIKLFKVTGLGGRRSVGYGRIKDVIFYDTAVDEINRFFDMESEEFVSLSVVFFQNINEFEKCVSYNLYLSKGFIGFPIWNHRRKTVVGVKEGAVFKGKISGRNFGDVSPSSLNISIPLVGKPILLPIGDSQ